MFSQVSFNIVVGLLVRGVLLMAAGWLVSKGILPQGSVEEWVGAAVLAVCGLGWSYYAKYASKQETDTLVATAIAMPSSALISDVKLKVDSGTGASPLDVTRKLGPVVLLCLLLPFTSGCAPTLKAKLQQVDAGVYSALMAVDKAEQGLFDQQVVCGAAPCVSAVTHQKFSKDFATALRAGKTFHLSVAAWKPGQPVPVDVNQVALALKAATDTVKSAIPAGPQKDQLGLLLDAAAFAVNQALLALLPPAQANVLMPSPVYAVN
jgi:hypothetical protein